MCDELPKPKLRGLLQAQIARNLPIAICLALLGGLARKYFIEKKKKRYRDFYANYDIDKEFDEITNLGLFQSCP